MMRSLQTMAWPVLLGCISLWAGLALAEVAPFSEKLRCPDFFYKGIPPNGFNTPDMPLICQRYNHKFHFATLYDRTDRIPRWSAYKLNATNCSGEPRRMFNWFVEPQLADLEKNPYMTTESKSDVTNQELSRSQAIGEDYEDTSYDRGQLNPEAYHCDNDHVATFTLTNAVPMDPGFHQLLWSKLEQVLKTYLNKHCIHPGGSPYLVTGAVANGSIKIPREDTDKEGDRNRTYNLVSVPSHIWTAVCCNQANETQKFSFAFLAENKEESRLQIMSVENLNEELACLYSSAHSYKIFSDDCGSNTTKEQIVLSAVKSTLYNTFQTLLVDSYSQLLPPDERSQLDAETVQVMGNLNLDKDSVRLTGIEFTVTFRSLADWYRKFKEIYDQGLLSCVLTPAAGAAKDSGTSDRVCTLQKQKHLPGSSVTANGWSCVGKPCGTHNQTKYSWCYTSSYSMNWDDCCTSKCTMKPDTVEYECSRGDGSTVACSPQYSTVTIKGESCRADHPCGLYGKRYHWCYTDDIQNWDYCCSPRHYCGHHDNIYNWCYIDHPKKDWQYCTP